jgi:VanZ family protein
MTTQHFCRLGAWIAIAALGLLSLLPSEYMVRTTLGGHIEHILAYAGTAIILAAAYSLRSWLSIAAGLICYAGVLELLQHLSPGRTSSIRDFAFSSSGVLLGLALFAIAERIVPLNRRGY